MKQLILILPSLYALYVAIFRSPEKAFFNVYLPVLLLLPTVYQTNISKIPAWSFADFTVFVIFAVAVFTRTNRYKFSMMDLLVVGYVGCCVFSELINVDAGHSRHLFTDLLTTVIAPYFLAKMLIVSSGLTIPFVKRFVWLMFVNVLLSVYEMKFTANPYTRFLDKVFPDQNQQGIWPTPVRYGLVRIAGPFIQAILFGTGIGMAVLFNFWLMKNKFGSKGFKYCPLPISKGKFILVALILGMLCTVSRGPVVGTILGGLFLGAGYAKNRTSSFFIRAGILTLIFVFAYEVYSYYSSIDKELTSSEAQASAAYRAGLVERFYDPISQKPYWGWGSLKYGESGQTRSVDNQYILVAVQNGLIALATYVCIIITTLFGLIWRGLWNRNDVKEDTSFCFTIFSVYLMLVLTLGTVYMGLQLQPLFFLLTGWINGYLASRPGDFYTTQKVEHYTARKLPKAV